MRSPDSNTVTAPSPPARNAGDLFRDLRLAISYVPLDEIKVYGRNPRKHSRKQIDQLAEAIRAFGVTSPLQIDDAGLLIAGHGRLAALRKLGYAEAPVVILSHLSEAEKRALRIADNKLAELAGWDANLLKLEFNDLLEFDLKGELSFDPSVTGFSAAEIDMVVSAPSDEADRDDLTELPAPDQPAVSRLGDAWELAEHRLFCGNALNESDFAALLGEERARLVLTDPPYNVRIDGHVSGLGAIRHREFPMASGEMSEAEFTDFLASVFSNLMKFSVDGSLHSHWMDWKHAYEIMSAGRSVYSGLKALCVWNKGTGGMGSLYRSQHELVFVFKSGKAPHINNVLLGRFGRNRTNVFDYPGANSFHPGRDEDLAMHPTVKPVAMLAEMIRDCSNRGDIVLDCFGGSGSTLIAAAKTGRRARLMELDLHYVDTIVRRWEKWSGQKVYLRGSGLTFAECERDRLKQPISDADSVADPAPASVGSPPSPPRYRARSR